MKSRQIAVIDPGLRVPELDTFNHIAQMSQLPTTLHLPGIYGMDSVLFQCERTPPTAIVILGSEANVDESHDFQAQLITWLEKYLADRVPVLGICYGHQLLGHMFGGEVGYMYSDKRKLKGFRDVKLDAASRLWSKVPASGKLYVSHRQAILKVPDEMRVIASSDDCPIDGIEHKSLPVWGFQPHPETTANFIKNQGVNPMPPEYPQLMQYGHSLVAHFLQFAAGLS